MKYYTLITGATGGLGRAYCDECAKNLTAQQGLIITGTKDNKLSELATQLNEQYGVEVVYKACDLSNAQNRDEFFAFTDNYKIDRVILNAGLIMVEQAFAQNDREKVLNAVRINCEANTDFAYNFLSKRDKNKEFYLIAVSSFAGFNPMPQMAVYGATKSYLLNFFVALREEYRNQKVKISCVCPSGMATTQEMQDSINAQGIGGKMTQNDVADIAHISIKKNIENKAIIVVGGFNKFLRFAQANVTKPTVAKFINKRWTKIINKKDAK